MTSEKRSLGDKVLVGATWIGAGRVAVRGIAVVSTLILARLLAPEDFGLVAVAMAVIALLSHMSDFGFNQALIRFQDASRADYDTAWTLNFIRGLLMSAFVVALALPLSHFYEEPRLANIMLALAIIPLVSGCENVRFIDLEKDMKFHPIAFVMIGAKVISFIATVTVAVITRSYWALIVGAIVSECVRLAAPYWFVPYRPRLTFRKWRRLMSFSGWLLGANFLQALSMRMDEPILQKVIATQAVGIFYVSKDLVLTPMREIATPVRRALFPGLSQLSTDSPMFANMYFSVVGGLFMIVAPIGVGITLVASDAVPLLLGSQWRDAVMPMQVFGVYIAVAVIGQTALSTVMASGWTRLWFNRTAIMLPIQFGIFIPAAMNWGLKGAVIGLFLAGLVRTYLDIAMANRVIGSSLIDHLKPCRRTAVALLVMVLVVLGIAASIPPRQEFGASWYVAGALLCKATLGAATYGIAHWILWNLAGCPDGPESRLLSLVRSLLMKKTAADGPS